MIVRYPLPAGCAIAPPAVMHGLPSPMAHPRCGRPYGITSPYYITPAAGAGRIAIRPLQTGKAGHLSASITAPTTARAVADSAIKVIRVLSGRWFRGGGRVPWVTLRSPTAKSLRLSPSGSRLSGDMAAQSGCRRVRGVGRIAIRPSHITQTAQMPQKGKAQQAPKVLDHA